MEAELPSSAAAESSVATTDAVASNAQALTSQNATTGLSSPPSRLAPSSESHAPAVPEQKDSIEAVEPVEASPGAPIDTSMASSGNQEQTTSKSSGEVRTSASGALTPASTIEDKGGVPAQQSPRADAAHHTRVAELEEQLRKKEKALAQAAALIHSLSGNPQTSTSKAVSVTGPGMTTTATPVGQAGSLQPSASLVPDSVIKAVADGQASPEAPPSTPDASAPTKTAEQKNAIGGLTLGSPRPAAHHRPQHNVDKRRNRPQPSFGGLASTRRAKGEATPGRVGASTVLTAGRAKGGGVGFRPRTRVRTPAGSRTPQVVVVVAVATLVLLVGVVLCLVSSHVKGRRKGAFDMRATYTKSSRVSSPVVDLETGESTEEEEEVTDADNDDEYDYLNNPFKTHHGQHNDEAHRSLLGNVEMTERRKQYVGRKGPEAQ